MAFFFPFRLSFIVIDLFSEREREREREKREREEGIPLEDRKKREGVYWFGT